MRRASIVVLAVIAVLVLPAAASADQPQQPTITDGPADGSIYAAPDATFAFNYMNQTVLPIDGAAIGDVIDLECSVDGGPDQECSSGSFTASGLSDGWHVFAVYAEVLEGSPCDPEYPEMCDPNPVGRPSYVASRGFTVDVNPPVATLASAPGEGAILPVSSASFTFSATDVTAITWSCSIDGAPATACSSPLSLSGLADGDHSVVATPTDAAGHIGNALSRKFTVDTTPPVAAFTSGPGMQGTVTADSASFGFSASDRTAVSFRCAIDGPIGYPCSSPFTVNSFGPGAHFVIITPTDAAGNQGVAITRIFVYRPTRKCRLAALRHGGKVVRSRSGRIRHRRVCWLVTS